MVFAVALWIVGVINCVSSISLDITPKQVHIRPNTNVSVMCQADSPVTTCQFKFKSYWKEGPLVDLSLGDESFVDSTFVGGDITGYRYFGTGLQDGQCGILLRFGRWGSRTVGCRVSKEGTGWEYAEMVVAVDSRESFPFIPSPREVVAQNGEEVNLMCTAEVPLTDCTFSIPGKEVARFNQGRESPNTSLLRYYGTGLENGQCGASLRVTDGVNGNVACAGKTDNKKEHEVALIFITIAKPPSSVELDVGADFFTVGDVMNATCTVADSRPPANITWYLDDKIIRQDSENNNPLETLWLWKNDTRTTIQKVSRKLLLGDNRKKLKCVAKHLALRNELLATKDLRVDRPPACGTLKSSTVDAVCFLDAVFASCESPVPPGTNAVLQCKTGFLLQPDPGYREIKCLPSGEWSRPMFECLTNCGQRNTKGGKPLISYGDDARIGEFPWHVALYEIIDRKHVLICGGSLISKNIVVSAAHCFWNDQYTKVKDRSLFTAVAGKHFNEWDHINDTDAQIREVKTIAIPRTYRGRIANFASDIAVVQVVSAFDFSSFVNTVCVDWNNDRERVDFRPNINGTVTGWGYTENGAAALALQVVELPYATDEKCINSLPRDLWKSFTPDKFCAGYVGRNISVCRGDSGGGIAFRNVLTDKYFLRGIVSVSFAPANYSGNCFSQLYTGFTKFSDFRGWVQGFI